jgi:MFS family permease
MTGSFAAPTSPSIVVEPPEQRRTLAVLLLAQILSGAGLAAGITVAALLAEQMLGSSRWSGLPTVFFTVGSAAAAVGLGRLSQRFGRRAGLSTGYLIGALGTVGVVVAAGMGNIILFFASMIVYGAGAATNLQARYAGADLAAPSRRGRAVSIVLVATAVGAILGPNLVSMTGMVATKIGFPGSGRAIHACWSCVQRRGSSAVAAAATGSAAAGSQHCCRGVVSECDTSRTLRGGRCGRASATVVMGTCQRGRHHDPYAVDHGGDYDDHADSHRAPWAWR